MSDPRQEALQVLYFFLPVIALWLMLRSRYADVFWAALMIVCAIIGGGAVLFVLSAVIWQLSANQCLPFGCVP